MKWNRTDASYSRDRFPGPSASWVNEDELAYTLELRQASQLLADVLRRRIAVLEDPDVTLEVLLDEIRRHIAACAVDGHVTVASDMSDLALSLASAREARNRGG